MKKKESIFNISDFSKKIIKSTSIVIIMILCTFLILKGFKVLLLILAGVLFATFFRGIASAIESKLPFNSGLSLFASVLLVVTVFSLTLIGIAPRVSSQMQILDKELPLAAKEAQQKIESSPVGYWVIQQIRIYKKKYERDSEKLTLFFSSFFGGLADIYIIFFLGFFFMIQPKMYSRGIILLFPKPKRERAHQVVLTMGYTLKKWLLGKLLSMIVVGVLTGIGLAILGVPLALTLAIFAALITFIPNFGPIIALIPAFLLAFTKGVDHAIYVCILYAFIQAVESNIITPIIQRKMISFPLAMILIAQVVLGIFTGVLGLILAVPVVAIIMVVIKMVYIEDILGDYSVEVKGEEKYINKKFEPQKLEE
ncbi:AI-2E family transporter [Aquimarina spongiae]|uniref:Predicted PurR-regulated permease PerM n=1 Tax=Aquimarina spongiae TaxID=570521 RepID=A0A1M6GLH8_9FLAO|nr:AI-2E family transporter [Aquimarina spongiae]SHJ10726.1 Predicted PurR-regulated permease PerM [Aquimarina spongiae]